jgi:hypothetical protein
MGVLRQVVRVEVRLAAQLHDALEFVGVFGFLVGVFEEFFGGDAGLMPLAMK